MTAMYHTIIGLPKSGKTTFLAALWHVLNAGEVSTKLQLDKLIGDSNHLNGIVEAWRRCDEVPHTSIAAETSVTIHIQDQATGRKAVLGFPDLSGESFELQVASRKAKIAYIEGLRGDGGILLFVTADRAQDGMTILDLAPLIAEPLEAELKEVSQDKDVNRKHQVCVWKPSLVPEQVQLVELLQFLQRKPFPRKKRRVAVVVSAWDVVLSKLSAEDWLSRELPLLHQFLLSNPDDFDFRVYGVSAQGGDVTSKQKDELLRKTPSLRIQCEGRDTEAHDLTAPVVWLMSEH